MHCFDNRQPALDTAGGVKTIDEVRSALSQRFVRSSQGRIHAIGLHEGIITVYFASPSAAGGDTLLQEIRKAAAPYEVTAKVEDRVGVSLGN